MPPTTLLLLLLVTAAVGTFAAPVSSLGYNSTGNNPPLSFDGRSFLFGLERKLLLSGTLHYPRIPAEDWANVLAAAADLGLNTVQTYVFWSFHQPVSDANTTWSGQADLVRFITLAAQANLYVTLRIGPYVCAEYYYGGVPLWMRQRSGCFRCSDAGWEAGMRAWLSEVVDRVRPLLYPAGPVILLQVENEYTGGDQQYLDWAVAVARNTTTQVPWFLCHDESMCATVNKGKQLALCSINGFWMDHYDKFVNQPSPAWVQAQHANNPSQPLMWSEDQAWFDQWGIAQRGRNIDNDIYGIARWLAYGGAYHNFYCLSGGSQYGLIAGGRVATAYAPDALIDSYLLRRRPRFTQMQRLFTHVRSGPIATALLGNPAATPQHFTKPSLKDVAEYAVYGDMVVLSNMGDASINVAVNGHAYTLANQSVVFANNTDGTVLLDIATLRNITVPPGLSPHAVTSAHWEFFQETPGQATRSVSSPSGPVDQVAYTNNDSDYAWYNTTIASELLAAGGGTITVTTNQESIAYVYMNGLRVTGGSMPAHDVADVVARGPTASVQILSAAMGMANTGVKPSFVKGVATVTVGGTSITEQPWTLQYRLAGEAAAVFDPTTTDKVHWQDLTAGAAENSTATWFRTRLDLPGDAAATWREGSGQPNQTAYVLDLSPMTKGVAYVNGFMVGRYWLVPGTCDGECAYATHGKCYLTWRAGACGKPTQHLYHVPAQVLQPTDNLVVLFEEDAPGTDTGVAPTRDPKGVALRVIHDHPSP